MLANVNLGYSSSLYSSVNFFIQHLFMDACEVPRRGVSAGTQNYQHARLRVQPTDGQVCPELLTQLQGVRAQMKS